MLYGAISSILLVIISTTMLTAQVPPGYDLSQAKPWRTVWKVTYGGRGNTAPLYITHPCGAEGRSMLLAGSSSDSRSFWTEPRIDTSQRGVLGWGDYHIRYDYDGQEPLEYMSDDGYVAQCLDSGYPFKKQQLDQIYCFGVDALSSAISADVDGDGYLDVVCEIGGGGKAFMVISGGPQAGKGCERVVSIDKPVYGAGIEAFYRSSFGPWRMIMSFRADGEELLVLYDVEITRTSPRGDGLKAEFIPRDTVLGSSREPGSPSSFSTAVIVQDTILHKDFMVLKYKPLYTQWVTERFDVTDGQFVASGDRVVGLEMLSTTDMPSLGHSLGTPYPVFHSSTATDGQLYFSVYDLVHAIAYWRAGGSGVQPVAGRAIINDQTGDGMPDMVISGGNPAGLILLTLDTSIVSVDVQEPPQTDFRAHISGMTLTVQATHPCSISIDIASVDGRTLYTSPAIMIDTGEYRRDMSPVLQPLPAGAYFVRVRCGAHVITLPTMHVHQ